MSSIEITERELKVIDEVSKDVNLTQRQISRRVGISLGMVNIILKKLAKKGYIKARQLNGKKIQYILTPKGFAEKARRSYRYLLRTISSIRQIKEEVQQIILKEYEKGQKSFIILGDGELADIVEMSLKDLRKEDLRYRRAAREEDIRDVHSTVLVAELNPDHRFRGKYIDILANITRSI